MGKEKTSLLLRMGRNKGPGRIVTFLNISLSLSPTSILARHGAPCQAFLTKRNMSIPYVTKGFFFILARIMTPRPKSLQFLTIRYQIVSLSRSLSL